ncbi:MAG TPA: MarR family transcriptional regulator [Acidisoma sp.]|jgi:MarR family transcriptional regulator for hemolysin|uniref:MarR family winged helix-turn-helix transcriptional regulator n=1 Tax=Acidisoma sp. TaxID=1872115 RepID=UPI002C26E66D|nr:MarR family transcriptional regulator [Acidisoma sp.]HTI02794.1 MarR family transcriptional regulator [Acidisoma sp.]
MAKVPHEEDLLFLIGDTARLIGTYADRIARSRGMSKAQWVLLLKLARHPGLSQKDLAQMMEVEPITVGRLVDRLASHGLVERVPDEQDRRVWRLHLLPAAEPVLDELAERRKEIVAMVCAGIDDAMAETMRQGLVRAKTNVTCALRGTERQAEETDSKKAEVQA